MPVTQEYKAVLLGSGDASSGEGGSTIKEILRSSALGLIAVKFDVVIINNSPMVVPGFYQKIEDHNREFGTQVEVRTVNRFRYPAAENEVTKDGTQTLAEAQACVEIIEDAGTTLYVQAGFMKKVVGPMLDLNGINTHPGPLETSRGLPGVDTRGLHGVHIQEKVLEEGWPYSAHTVHEVAEEYDEGSIYRWRPVFVKPGDTPEKLFARVQDVEKACLPFDIEAYAVQLPHA